ncbi:DUF3124 domain-containing protein [Fodinibius sediminis]|uniref:DUF3124 domain-containing protein n=1 Tax=Fodinibius sediminis TaxID=1214077 RepID=A0A521BIH1_9BACT|nr:DUF3124 domain-containing protein [Fodinibius sediminis]SMO46924.1 Protein of unknown function [Fodinibius sediminis]
MRFVVIITLVGVLLSGCAGQQGGSSNGSASSTAPEEGSQKQHAGSALPQPLDASSYEREDSSLGQLIYVPVYSHIYQQDRQKTFNLTTTLSIRNVDPHRSMIIREVIYYDSHGELVQQYLKEPTTLQPLSSTSFVIEERDLRGGVGANFLVSWLSDHPVNPPVVEAVMISTSQQQGISFLSKGRVLQELQGQPAETGTD